MSHWPCPHRLLGVPPSSLTTSHGKRWHELIKDFRAAGLPMLFSSMNHLIGREGGCRLPQCQPAHSDLNPRPGPCFLSGEEGRWKRPPSLSSSSPATKLDIGLPPLPNPPPPTSGNLSHLKVLPPLESLCGDPPSQRQDAADHPRKRSFRR